MKMDLVELVGIVKGHQGNIVLGSILDKPHRFARIGKDDLTGRNTKLEHDGNLLSGSTVEADPQVDKGAQKGLVSVAFDRIKGLHPRQQVPPSFYAADRLAKIHCEKGLSVVSLLGGAL